MCSFDGGDRTDHYLWQVAREGKPLFTPKETKMKALQLVMRSESMILEESERAFHIVVFKDKSNETLWVKKS